MTNEITLVSLADAKAARNSPVFKDPVLVKGSHRGQDAEFEVTDAAGNKVVLTQLYCCGEPHGYVDKEGNYFDLEFRLLNED